MPHFLPEKISKAIRILHILKNFLKNHSNHHVLQSKYLLIPYSFLKSMLCGLVGSYLAQGPKKSSEAPLFQNQIQTEIYFCFHMF